MLLKEKIFLMVITLLLLMPTISYAQSCEVSRVKSIVKKTLHLYFTQKNISVTKNQVKDLLTFYLSINSQNLTADCSAYGSTTNQPIINIVNFADSLPDTVPNCADGTKYGECSNNKPGYCFAGKLYNKCQVCGCPSHSRCGPTGGCARLSQNITCSSNLDCGKNEFTGNYYCTNDYITKNYVNNSCINPGTTSSKCVSANGTIYLAYCNPSLNQVCVSGQNYCNAPVINTSTATNQTNQTPFSGIVTLKGRLINHFTKQPITNAIIFTWDNQTTKRDVYTNINGEFSIAADAAFISTATPKSFGISPACYDNMGFAIFRNPDGSLYVSMNIFDLIGADKYFSITGAEVNLGEIPLWPAVTINVFSDILVKFNVQYGSIDGGGNSLFKASHTLSYSFPLNADARIKLTDSIGNIYYSPSINLPLSNGCNPVSLNFSNKQFNWIGLNKTNQTNLTKPTGVCLIRDSYTSVPLFSATDVGKGYAKMAKPGVNTISGLQSACSQANFSSLLQTYCTQNSNPIQEQVVAYDSQGNYQSLSCGAFGCNFKNCTSLINTTMPQCNDGIDNDGDSKIDYPADLGCLDSKDTNETDTILNSCYDTDNGVNLTVTGTVSGVQNGKNFSYTDWCYDLNFVIEYNCTTNGWSSYLYACTLGKPCLMGNCFYLVYQCSDGIDNDGNGLKDYPSDPQCSSTSDNYEGAIQCSDGIDNDLNGKMDYPSDPGCTSLTDNDESNNQSVIRITTDGYQQAAPSVSDRAIVWKDSRNYAINKWDIYAYDFLTGKEVQLTSRLTPYCSDTATGAKISCPNDINVLNSATDQDSPDISGTKVVYEDDAHLCYAVTKAFGPLWGSCQDIYMYDFTTGTNSLVSSHLGNQNNPKIDGNRVVWDELPPNSSPQVWYKDLSTGVEEKIDDGINPAISGDIIVYRHGGASSPAFAVYNIATRSTFNVITNYAGQFPDVDGNNIVYTDFVDGAWHVFLYDLSKNTKRQLSKASGKGNNKYPYISGNKVIYADDRFANAAIGQYIINLAIYDLNTNQEQFVIINNLTNNYPGDIYNGKVVLQSNLYDLSDVLLYSLNPSSCGDGMCLVQKGETITNCPLDCH